MGYMTVISVLNDAWDTIKENKDQFIDNIDQGMQEYHTGKSVNSYPVSNYANPMEVHRSFHANLNKVLVVGGNHMEDLTDLNQGRINSDYYLAYKMRMVNLARSMAESASIEIIDAFAETIANSMIQLGLDVDHIREYVEKTDAFAAMNENEQTKAIVKIACLLNNK